MTSRSLRTAASTPSLVLAAATFTAALLVAAAISAGQTPTATPPAIGRFEVTSVKRNMTTLEELIRSGERFGIRELPGGRLSARRVSLKTLVLHAYEIKDYQLESSVSWIGNDNFDVDAAGTPDATPTRMKAMLRTKWPFAGLNLKRLRRRRHGHIASNELAATLKGGRGQAESRAPDPEPPVLERQSNSSSGRPPRMTQRERRQERHDRQRGAVGPNGQRRPGRLVERRSNQRRRCAAGDGAEGIAQ